MKVHISHDHSSTNILVSSSPFSMVKIKSSNHFYLQLLCFQADVFKKVFNRMFDGVSLWESATKPIFKVRHFKDGPFG